MSSSVLDLDRFAKGTTLWHIFDVYRLQGQHSHILGSIYGKMV